MSESTRNVISVVDVLGIVFVILKLSGAIHWPWWWVLLPFYLPYVVVLAVVGLAWVVVGIAKVVENPNA